MSFEWVRGTCPRCGTDQVLHHVIGMPMLEAYESSPPWVIWEGCVGLGPDRECLDCAHSWSSDDVGFAEEPEPRYDPLTDEAHPGDPAPLRVVGAVIVREELGIEVEIGWLIGRGEADARDRDRDLHLDCYWARLNAAEPAGSTDHDRLEWVDRAHLQGLAWAGPDVPIVEAIVDGAVPRFRAG